MEINSLKDSTLQFLKEKESLTAVIGTVTPEGNPHTAVVYYFVNENFNFYFLTATNTRKYNYLLKNPNTSIVIGFGPSYVTIQGSGTSTLIEKASDEENEAITQIKKRLQDHNNETWPAFQLDKLEGESIAVFKFTPESLYLLNLESDNGLVVTTEELQKII